jgi:anti-sigma factor RsiW
MECSELDRLAPSYVDGAATADERARVDDHLTACAPCRARVDAERAARDFVRAGRADLHEPAPRSLRSRCERVCARPSVTRSAVWRALPLALAAAAALMIAVVWLGRFNAGTGVLAAQLTLDHVKCNKFGSTRVSGSPGELAAYWQTQAGWPILVPAGFRRHDLRLAGIRRCASSEGQTAHIIYSYGGRPMSLFIARDDTHRTARDLHMFGHEAIVWSSGSRTYVLVGQEPREQMQAIAAILKKDTQRP